MPNPIKVLFLDIDGVLNTHKTGLLYGSVFSDTPNVAKLLDPYASLFIKRLTQHGVQIVLSSTWRLGIKSIEELSGVFDFPLTDLTCSRPFRGSIRGDEIEVWLKYHPQTTHYCIVDDDSDMRANQMPYFVNVNGEEGLTFEDMTKICTILGFDIWALADYR